MQISEIEYVFSCYGFQESALPSCYVPIMKLCLESSSEKRLISNMFHHFCKFWCIWHITFVDHINKNVHLFVQWIFSFYWNTGSFVLHFILISSGYPAIGMQIVPALLEIFSLMQMNDDEVVAWLEAGDNTINA